MQLADFGVSAELNSTMAKIVKQFRYFIGWHLKYYNH